MTNKHKLRVFSSVELLNKSAAELLVQIADESVKAKGRFLLCLSGGNTPKSLYALLSVNPYRELIPWENTFVFWGDERCVPADDDRNNAHEASEVLLKKTKLPSSHIFPIPVNLPPADAANKYEQTLRDFFGPDLPCFDLILLGLGENGHTASLFPGTAVLWEKSRWVQEVFVKEQQMNRITMTATLINKAHHILFLVSGAGKSGILEEVLTAPYQPEKYPAQLISPEQGEVLWFADTHAATGIRLNDSIFLDKDT